MNRGLTEAIGVFTILPVSNTTDIQRRNLALNEALTFYATVPLVGLFFGAIGMAVVRLTFHHLIFLMAWGVPMVWLIASGGRHAGGLCRTINALFVAGTTGDRRAALSKGAMGASATFMGLTLILGKIFALLQGQTLGQKTLTLLVFLTPVFSRYVVLVLALDTPDALPVPGPEQGPKQLGVLIAGSLMLFGLSLFSLGVAAVLFVSSLAALLLVRGIAIKRLGAVGPQVADATLEVAEVLMLWMPVVFAGFGIQVGSI